MTLGREGMDLQAWAKSQVEGDGKIHLLSLVDHCCDVAATFAALLDLPTLRARLARLAKRELTAADRQRLCALVALHDAGKANIGFQNRILHRGGLFAGHIEPFVSLLDPEPRGGNEVRTQKLRDDLFKAIGIAELETWAAAGLAGLLHAILAHHGRLPKEQPVIPAIWQATSSYDPFAALTELQQAVRAWFPDAFGPVAARLPSAPRFLHALAGLVMLADWLGSDSEKFQFPSDGAPTGLERMPYSRRVAAQVLGDRFLDPAMWRQAAANRPAGFDDLFPGIGAPRWPQTERPLADPKQLSRFSLVEINRSITVQNTPELDQAHTLQGFRPAHPGSPKSSVSPDRSCATDTSCSALGCSG